MVTDFTHLCQRYLDRLCQPLTPYADAERYKKHNLSATQGEILHNSIHQLIRNLSFQEQDVFFDLGSGVGRVAAQFFLTTPVQAACGIELIPELYQQSLQIAQQIQKELPEFYQNGRKLHFIQGSFLESSFQLATMVLMNAVCFNQQTLVQVSALIDRNTRIHTLMSLRPVPNLQRLRFVKTIALECTWDSALCYLYKNR